MMKDGGSAFPGTIDKRALEQPAPGMSLRDYFAAAALQGMFANPRWDARQVSDPKRAAFSAYNYADAMLSERKKSR